MACRRLTVQSSATGYEVAARLRDREAERPPLLAAVSWRVTLDEHRRSAVGLDLHLEKPVEPAVLVGALKRSDRVPALI